MSFNYSVLLIILLCHSSIHLFTSHSMTYVMKKQDYKIQTSVYLPIGLMDIIRQYVEKTGRSRQEVYRRAIQAWIKDVDRNMITDEDTLADLYGTDHVQQPMLLPISMRNELFAARPKYRSQSRIVTHAIHKWLGVSETKEKQ